MILISLSIYFRASLRFLFYWKQCLFCSTLLKHQVHFCNGTIYTQFKIQWNLLLFFSDEQYKVFLNNLYLLLSLYCEEPLIQHEQCITKLSWSQWPVLLLIEILQNSQKEDDSDWKSNCSTCHSLALLFFLLFHTTPTPWWMIM